MIDLVSIFTKGGAVLWQRELNPISESGVAGDGSGLSELVQNVLVEGRQGQYAYQDDYTMRWALDNSLGLVFVAVYLNLGKASFYVEPLLAAARARFAELFGDHIRCAPGSAAAGSGGLALAAMAASHCFRDFDLAWDCLLDEFEGRNGNKLASSSGTGPAAVVCATSSLSPEVAAASPAEKKPRSFNETRKGRDLARLGGGKKDGKKKWKSFADDSEEDSAEDEQQQLKVKQEDAADGEVPLYAMDPAERRKLLNQRFGAGGAGGRGKGGKQG